MATTYENMVLREMHRHEHQSKKSWGTQHAPDHSVFGLETQEFARLDALKDQVADLCDLQPTPASMVRPPRKEALKTLRAELAKSLSDVETQLEALGGSASTVSHVTNQSNKTSKSMKSTKSLAPPSTIAEEDE